MAVLRLPPRDDRPTLERRRQPGAVVDISRRDMVHMPGMARAAGTLAQPRTTRDLEAGIRETIRDFRKLARKRFGVRGAPLDGAAIVAECALRRAINQIREEKKWLG